MAALFHSSNNGIYLLFAFFDRTSLRHNAEYRLRAALSEKHTAVVTELSGAGFYLSLNCRISKAILSDSIMMTLSSRQGLAL